MCNLVRQRRFTARDSRAGWNHLLADRRHYAIEWTEPEALPFAGEKVTVSGKVYKRGGSKAIVIEKIEPEATPK